MAKKNEIIVALETIKGLLKTNQRINKSKLSREFQIDRKTISKLVKNVQENENFVYKRNLSKKLLLQIQGFKKIIEEKLKDGDSIFQIYLYLKNEYEVNFSYQYLTHYLRGNDLRN